MSVQRTLMDLCLRITDGTHQSPKFISEGIPFLFSSNIVDGKISFDTKKFISKEMMEVLTKSCPIQIGDILYTAVGSYGRAAVVDDGRSFAFQRHVAHLKPNLAEVCPNFLKHFLNSSAGKSQADKVARGVAQKTVTLSDLKEFKVFCPSLREQRRIAAILDGADALRAKRRAALEQIDGMAQAIFIEMFGGPRNQPSQDKLSRLGDFADILVGFPFNSDAYINDTAAVRLCRGANVLPGQIDWGDVVRWPLKNTDLYSQFALEVGDTLIAMDRPWISSGFKVAQICSADLPALLVQRVARLRPKSLGQASYLFNLVRQSKFQQHCKPTETTVPHISPNDIRSFLFYEAPMSAQLAFHKQIMEITELRQAAMQAAELFDALFASLQHRAFTGAL